ncbi:Alpha-L RNA-binding motif/Ribosomal protein S4 family protein [Zea mays]|uniref:U3 small nucleolar ribonucleoprotein protein IMP3 n=1 Tax=Zea mays TaxID=4577 RepID=A0A1D6LW26_MAIZE|nr:Alpha-L RNA-binding motif/Ribosomal protein S4 family protein [Zea mays]
MRKLKFHEQKLLKRHNFLEYKREGGHREALVTQRYRLVERDDYKKYNGICLMVQKLVNIIKQMDPRDPFRIQMTDLILDKLVNVPKVAWISEIMRFLIIFPAFQMDPQCVEFHLPCLLNSCRRRLATVMVKLKFAEHLKEAVTYIEQGHVRVGPDAVTDPAFLVTRNMEDFITWVDSSKIKRKVMEYNDALDDYDAMF